MATYIETRSFFTSTTFNHLKDDEEMNKALGKIQSHGGQIKSIEVRLYGKSEGFFALYLITYEASQPIS